MRRCWLPMGALVLASGAAAADDAKWHIDVVLDTYYQVDLGYPHVHVPLAGRDKDQIEDRAELANLQINVVRKPTDKSPWGATVSLSAGRDADITNSTDPAGSRYETFLQAYVSYLFKGKKPVTLDVGRFLPLIGFESTNTYENDSYGSSALSTWGQPAYHLGVRATCATSPKTSLAIYVVNGWNDMEDSNDGKSVGLTWTWNPDPKTSFSFNYLGGDEGGRFVNDAGTYGGIGFASPGTRFTQLGEVIATYQPSDKLTWAADLCMVDADGRTGASSGQWTGGLLAAKYALSPLWAAVARVDAFNDERGILTGTPVTFVGLAGTVVYTLKGGSQLKLEYRHENASALFFTRNSGPSRYRDTLAFAQIIRF